MDRAKKTERMLRIWLMIYTKPDRFSASDLANIFEITERTIYRDIEALESQLGVPITVEKGKYGVSKTHYLPPLRLSVSEALNVFLSARLMVRYSQRYDPNIEIIFAALSEALPPQLKKQIENTLEWMRSLPKNIPYLRNMTILAEAWAAQRCVRITYRSFEAEKAIERVIEPYSIEPAAAGHSSYVVAHCRRANAIRIFKIERIESIMITGEPYTIPPDFSADEYFKSAWDIMVEGEAKTIRLKFTPQVSRLMEETHWHPSQSITRQKDGAVIMTLEVMDTPELQQWILGWGERVEVLEPKELRDAIMVTAEAMRVLYTKKN